MEMHWSFWCIITALDGMMQVGISCGVIEHNGGNMIRIRSDVMWIEWYACNVGGDTTNTWLLYLEPYGVNKETKLDENPFFGLKTR